MTNDERGSVDSDTRWRFDSVIVRLAPVKVGRFHRDSRCNSGSRSLNRLDPGPAV